MTASVEPVMPHCMNVKIKNCGLKTPEAIDQSIITGAHFVGFVHCEKSPRHVTIEQMGTLIKHTNGRVKTVAVLVDPSDETLDAINHARPDYIQLHDVSNIARIEAIAERYHKPIITALSLRSPEDITFANTLAEISAHVLFDAKSPGSGQPFDWKLLSHTQLHHPWFLAGGLTVENVAEAIRATGAPMVDVSSGIEDSPGNKSLEKIAAFNHAVLHAAHG